MKKSCKYCIALEYHNNKYFCRLGYKIESVIYLDKSFKAFPQEECPKPPTFDAFFTILQDRENVDRDKLRSIK